MEAQQQLAKSQFAIFNSLSYPAAICKKVYTLFVAMLSETGYNHE